MTKKEKNIEEIKKIISNYDRNLTKKEWKKIDYLRNYNFFKCINDDIEWSNDDFRVRLIFYGSKIERRIITLPCYSTIYETYDNDEIIFKLSRNINLQMVNFLLNDFKFSDKITKKSTIQEIKEELQELKEELLTIYEKQELINKIKEELLTIYEKQELIDKISQMSLEDIKKIIK